MKWGTAAVYCTNGSVKGFDAYTGTREALAMTFLHYSDTQDRRNLERSLAARLVWQQQRDGASDEEQCTTDEDGDARGEARVQGDNRRL
jgi:hypothetical protein